MTVQRQRAGIKLGPSGSWSGLEHGPPASRRVEYTLQGPVTDEVVSEDSRMFYRMQVLIIARLQACRCDSMISLVFIITVDEEPAIDRRSWDQAALSDDHHRRAAVTKDMLQRPPCSPL